MALKGTKKDESFTFEILEELGAIRINEKTGWSLEVNVVSWNGRDPKVDIREWDSDHSKMSKGITLTEKEALAVCEMIKIAID